MNRDRSYAFELRGVAKRYRYFALEPLDLRLEPGQVLGLVGPNGAGKSTTIRLLMGLVAADAGEIELLGHPIPGEAEAAKRDVGFVSEEMRLFGAATLGWHMEFVRALYPGWDESYARTLLDRFGLHREQRLRTLSRGEQMKALTLLALARRPKLLVLDEPTTGLDPVARHELLAELAAVLRDDDRSILFSSHSTLDVEQISDQIAFLDRGQLVAAADKESYLERWRRLTIELPRAAELPSFPGLVELSRSGQIATLTTDSWGAELEFVCESAGARILETRRLSLEEIFVATVLDRRKERAS